MSYKVYKKGEDVFYQYVPKWIFYFAIALVASLSLLSLGCSNNTIVSFRGIARDDLESRTFTAENCQALGIEGICTLTVGEFTGNNAPATIAATAMATGMIRVDEETLTNRASCVIDVGDDAADSDFPSGEGPQAGESLRIEPCEIEESTGELRFENASTGEISSFAPPI